MIISFPEFAEFSESLLHLGKTPLGLRTAVKTFEEQWSDMVKMSLAPLNDHNDYQPNPFG